MDVVEVTPDIIPAGPVVHHNFGIIGLRNIKKTESGALRSAVTANAQTSGDPNLNSIQLLNVSLVQFL